MENAYFSIKNSDDLTMALNINVTYINRKNYIIIHPLLSSYFTAAAAATTTTTTTVLIVL